MSAVARVSLAEAGRCLYAMHADQAVNEGNVMHYLKPITVPRGLIFALMSGLEKHFSTLNKPKFTIISSRPTTTGQCVCERGLQRVYQLVLLNLIV